VAATVIRGGRGGGAQAVTRAIQSLIKDQSFFLNLLALYIHRVVLSIMVSVIVAAVVVVVVVVVVIVGIAAAATLLS